MHNSLWAIRKGPDNYLLTGGTEAEQTVSRGGDTSAWAPHLTLPSTSASARRRWSKGIFPFQGASGRQALWPPTSCTGERRRDWEGEGNRGYSQGESWQGRRASLLMGCAGCGKRNFIARSSSTAGPLPGASSLSFQRGLPAPLTAVCRRRRLGWRQGWSR